MRRLLTIFISVAFVMASCFASTVFADVEDSSPIGWHWYDYTDSPLSPVTKKQPYLSDLTPTQAVKIIKDGTQEALNAAVLDPSEQNVMQYLAMQKWVTDQSSQFAAQYPKVLLDDPALDPHIQNPTEQMATQMMGQQMNQDQQKALKTLAAQNGVLFFYRGGNSMDELMCKVMAQFVSIYQIAIIPVTVDGQVSAAFPNSRQDEGKSAKLGISYFPAIMLVNPATDAIQPVAYGFLSQDELLKRFLLIANHFKPSYMGGT